MVVSPKRRRFFGGTALLLLLAVNVPLAGDGDPSPPAPRRTTLEEAIRRAEVEAKTAKDAPADAVRPGWTVSDFLGLFALMAALGLLVYATRWSRALMPFRAPGQREMVLLDRMATGKNSTLLLVRLRGRDYWIADHAAGVALLADVTPESEAADRREPEPLPTAKTPEPAKETEQ